MQVVGGNAEAATGAASPSRQTAWSHHAHRANPACVPNSRTLSPVGCDPFSQQVFNRLVLKILRHQVQLAIAESEPIENHRHCGLADTHASTGLLPVYPATPLCLLPDTRRPRFPNDPDALFGTLLLVTLFGPSPFFLTLTSNPFFRQSFCGMWAA